jgi:hypothetical protein
MQELYKNLCKMVKKMDKGGKWTWHGALGPLGQASEPHKGVARCPTYSCHVTDPWKRSSKASPPLISSWFNIKGSKERFLYFLKDESLEL